MCKNSFQKFPKKPILLASPEVVQMAIVKRSRRNVSIDVKCTVNRRRVIGIER